MPDVHYATMAGRDNMGYLLSETIAKCGKYFKTFTIVDTGATDNTAQLPASVINLHDWNDDWIKAYTAAMSNVPVGDWFLFMDSDEFPSPDLCKNIQSYVDEINSKGYNSCGIRSNHHSYDWNGNLTNRSMGLTDFTKCVIVKKLHTTSAAANGSHTMFTQTDRKHIFAPANFFYNHVKSDYTICRSLFTQGFRYPEHMGDLIKGIDLIKEFNSKTGFKTCADYLAYLETDMEDGNTDILKSWADSPYQPLRETHDILIKYRKNKFKPGFCSNSCCNYD
jgi:hypothetical protein